MTDTKDIAAVYRTVSDLITERDQLRAELETARAEIERLKGDRYEMAESTLAILRRKR